MHYLKKLWACLLGSTGREPTLSSYNHLLTGPLFQLVLQMPWIECCKWGVNVAY